MREKCAFPLFLCQLETGHCRGFNMEQWWLSLPFHRPNEIDRDPRKSLAPSSPPCRLFAGCNESIIKESGL
jgi:hypothetical protein